MTSRVTPARHVPAWRSELGRLAAVPHFLPLAAAIKLLFRFETGIEDAARLQFLRRFVIARYARRLPFFAIPVKTQPIEIIADRLRKRIRRPHHIGIVEAQQEITAMLACKQPVEDGRANIADVEPAGGARCEADVGFHFEFQLVLARRAP